MKVSVSKSKNTTIYYLSKSVRIDGKVRNGQSNTLQSGLQKREIPKKTSSSSTPLLPELKRDAVGV